jgi:hypothetical protein
MLHEEQLVDGLLKARIHGHEPVLAALAGTTTIDGGSSSRTRRTWRFDASDFRNPPSIKIDMSAESINGSDLSRVIGGRTSMASPRPRHLVANVCHAVCGER